MIIGMAIWNHDEVDGGNLGVKKVNVRPPCRPAKHISPVRRQPEGEFGSLSYCALAPEFSAQCLCAIGHVCKALARVWGSQIKSAPLISYNDLDALPPFALRWTAVHLNNRSPSVEQNIADRLLQESQNVQRTDRIKPRQRGCVLDMPVKRKPGFSQFWFKPVANAGKE
jgi:hypothetical protein